MTIVQCFRCGAAHDYVGPEPAFLVCPRCGWILRVVVKDSALTTREATEAEATGCSEFELKRLIAGQETVRALFIAKRTTQ